MSIPDASLARALNGSLPFVVEETTNSEDEWQGSDLTLFGGHSLDTMSGMDGGTAIGGFGYDRPIDGYADVWNGITTSQKSRDQALDSIMAEWSSNDRFAAGLPDSLTTTKADETYDGVTDPSTCDRFFSHEGDMWGNLLGEEEVETNSAASVDG